MLAPLAWARARSTAQLAAASALLGVLWLASFALVGDRPGALQVAQVLLGAVAAPLLAVAAGSRLLAPALGLERRLALGLRAAAALGVVALALTANSFAVGFDDADAGRPSGLFAGLTVAFMVAGVVGFAAALGIVFYALVRGRLSAPAAITVAAALGLVAAPFVAVTLLVPGSVIAVSLVVLVYASLPWLARTFAPTPARPRSPDGPPADVAPVRGRVILLSGAALALTLVVWVGGIATSVATTGTDVATTSLGLTVALSQLAGIPLVWAGTLLLAARRPATATLGRRGAVVASVTIAVTAVAMVVTYSPRGDGFFPLAGVLGLGIGFWAGSVVWALYPAFARGARVGVSVLAAAAIAVVYTVSGPLTGGIVVALVSGVLAFGGARSLLEPRPAAAGGSRGSGGSGGEPLAR